MIYCFIRSDALAEIETGPATDNPNQRYSIIISSASDADMFFSRFNHDNGYCYGASKLKLGDIITIQDGTYNVDWVIAGFDMEHNQTAADGTVYDNGYGICMIPKTQVTTGKWHNVGDATNGYISSVMHTSTLPSIVTKLQTILGSHIVNRNVLLSSGTDTTNYYSNAYTWTTAYATLMSVGQLTGEFARYRNKYDDGEANYKLPLFNYTGYGIGSIFTLRNIWTGLSIYNNVKYAYALYINANGSIGFTYGTVDSEVTYPNGIRPMIYLR